MDDLLSALRTDFECGGDFAGRLGAALGELGREVGGSEVLVEGRPGSWEAELVGRLAFGAGADQPAEG